jgi:hypothetical protein
LVGAAHVWPTGQEGCLHVQQTLAEATGLQKLSQKGSFQECLFYSHTRFPALDSLKNRGAQVGDMHTVQSVPLSMTLKLFQSRKLVSWRLIGRRSLAGTRRRSRPASVKGGSQLWL